MVARPGGKPPAGACRRTTGDHKGPPHIHPTTLAPTIQRGNQFEFSRGIPRGCPWGWDGYHGGWGEFPGSWLIDPLDGLSDLQARRLKAVDDQIFRHDPLRMLRAVRLMMRYQLQIDPWTASLITRDAQLLPEVAWERIHDELYAILGPDGATTRLHFLDEHNLFITIFPEFLPARGMRQPKPHHWDVLTHSIETVGALERIAHLVQSETMHALDPVGTPFMGGHQDGEDESTSIDLAEISSLLQEAEQQGIFSFAGLTAPRMKMAALLHDIGKPVTYSCDEEGAIHFYNHPLAGVPLVEQIMRRLCASTQDRRLAQLVAAHHMRPGQLGQDGPVTLRAIRRYFVDLGPTGIYVALFSLADHLATLGPTTCRQRVAEAPGSSSPVAYKLHPRTR